MRPAVVSLVLFSLLLIARPAEGQYQQYELMSCPTHIINFLHVATANNGQVVYFYANWIRNSHAGVNKAFYDPAPGQAVPIVSEDGQARWYNPGMFLACYKLVTYRSNGTIEFARDVYQVQYIEGEIKTCPSGGGGANPELDHEIYGSSYDPFDPVGGDGGAASITDVLQSECAETGSGGGGSDTWAGPGGTTCRYEYLVLEISNDGGMTWDVLWTGWGTVCE